MMSTGYATLIGLRAKPEEHPPGLNYHKETISAVNAAWRHAQEKHGIASTPKGLEQSNGTRLAVLVEEVGEVARAMCDRSSTEKLTEELYQVAAMALAWAEYLDEAVTVVALTEKNALWMAAEEQRRKRVAAVWPSAVPHGPGAAGSHSTSPAAPTPPQDTLGERSEQEELIGA